ncbi:hypothetical protein [Cellulosimicrobium sp. Marseille-Q4280]|uniref:hypothetical protein n=1 Tax=Cellulosimicrobium sp. Marseille-Q4280 TaxID=2937992 RepID=UPI00203B1E47|nr:hypothetical protein [Cellulosimicrobium sp. Marseille-Q4280]
MTLTLDPVTAPAADPSILEGLSGAAVLVHPANLADAGDLVWALASVTGLGHVRVVVAGQSARVTFAGARTVTICPTPTGNGWLLCTESPARTWSVELGALGEALTCAREVMVDAAATVEAITAATRAYEHVTAVPVTIVRDRPRGTTVATFRVEGERLTLVAAPGVGNRPRWRAFSSRDPLPWALSERASRIRAERLQRALCGADPGRAESYMRYLVEVFTKRVAEHDAHDFELMGRDL